MIYIVLMVFFIYIVSQRRSYIAAIINVSKLSVRILSEHNTARIRSSYCKDPY